MGPSRNSPFDKANQDLDAVAHVITRTTIGQTPLRRVGMRGASSVNEVDVVTPAQVHANPVRTRQVRDRALYCTIERRQPEKKAKVELQFVSSHLGNLSLDSPERGPSFAQRLYASALSSRSSTLHPSTIPVLPPTEHASSALPSDPCGVSSRKVLPSASLSDASPEVSQYSNPSGLYHRSIATHGFLPRGSPSAEAGATRHLPPLPKSGNLNSLSVTSLSYLANSLESQSSQNSTLQPEVQSPRSVLHSLQTLSKTARSHSTSAVDTRKVSGILGVTVEAHQDLHGTISSPSPWEQQSITSSLPPPPFSGHERLSSSFDELHSRRPLPGVNHEEIPLYSLVDEQIPPPAFDDLQPGTRASEVHPGESPMMQSETLSHETIEVSSSPPPPLQFPPPFSHRSTAYAPGKVLAYRMLDKASYRVDTGKGVFRDTKISLSSITTRRPLDLPVIIDFQRPNQPPSLAPPVSPSSTAHDENAISPMTPLLPSDSRPPSVLSSHSSDSQPTKTSHDHCAIHKKSSFPPPVNYHTKPTAKQRSGHPSLPPPALQSGSRPPEGSPFINVTEDNRPINAVTHSMSNMMKDPSFNAHNFVYENLSGKQSNLRLSSDNQRNIPFPLTSPPSVAHRLVGSEDQETRRPDAERLIREAYQKSTHAETSGRMGYGIQGLDAATPLVVSSQHLGLTPAVCSHDFQTESTRIISDDLTPSHFSEPVAHSSGSFYPDRPHVSSALPSRSLPYPLQPLPHPMDEDIREFAVPFGPATVPPQKIHFPQNMDPTKHDNHVSLPPTIALPPCSASKTPVTLRSQDSGNEQVGQVPALNSNDLANKFVREALLAHSDDSAHAFYGTKHR